MFQTAVGICATPLFWAGIAEKVAQLVENSLSINTRSGMLPVADAG